MSTKYKLELLDPAEDGALRAILRNTFMPGKISLSFQREPDFFRAEHAGNFESQIMGVRDVDSRGIVGFGCRSFHKGFIDGKLSTIGYLSGLRSTNEVRGGTLLSRAYRYLKQLHSDEKVPFYITTILDDNVDAKALLTSGRGGLPVYHPLGQLATYLLPLYNKNNEAQGNDEGGIQRGVSEATVECINAFNGRHQFGSFYTMADLHGRTSLLPSFDQKNLYYYQRGSEVTATIGVWDQQSFKQSVVVGYSPSYRLIQPLSGMGAWMGWCAKLPRVGKTLPYLYASFLSYAPGHDGDLECLIRQVLADWKGRGFAYLLIGVHDTNPLAGQLEQISAMKLSSTIYLVYWEDLLKTALPSEQLIPHLEIATL